MKRLFTFLLFLFLAVGAKAQTSFPSYFNWCQTGNVPALLSGLSSTNTLQGSYPACTVTVYLAGTQTVATIYSNSTGTAKANPFTANTDGSYSFFAATGFYDVKMSGGNNGGFPSPGFFTIPSVTLGSTSGGGGGGGGTILGTTTANLGVGAANALNTLAPVPEVNYKTTSGNTAFACQEDQNRGDWDVRCTRNGTNWATNPSQALINTIQAAVCARIGGGPLPIIHIPAGTYTIGGNISLPPGVDVEGTGSSEYGSETVLNTSDPTKAMFTHVGSQVFTCNGVPTTVNQGGGELGNLTLNGGGITSPNDVGLINNTGGATNEYIHNISFTGFGGPGRILGAGANGQNSRGSHIFFAADLGWYMFSGAYNTSGFTDTGAHCAMELYDLDSRWDHLEGTGYIPTSDLGYYNRYNLIGACFGGGGPNNWIKDSYIQFFPRNIYVANVNNGGQLIEGNRLDYSWWESISITAGTFVTNNLIQGFDTSPTLNPANFATNPGGVTTDANAAAIKVYQPFGLGSVIEPNSIGAGNYAQWPVYNVWSSTNTLNGATTTIDLPGATPGTIGGQIGGDSGAGNVGADVVRSMRQTTSGNHANTGPTIHFQGFAHTYLNDTSATNYTGADGIFPDTYVTVDIRSTNDTITAGSAVTLCGGVSSINSGIHWFYTYDTTIIKEVCPSSGSGTGTIAGSGTVGKIPIFVTNSTTIGNSHLDETTNPGYDTFIQGLFINDGTSFGGGNSWTEGNVPTGVVGPAAGKDVTYADVVAHWMLFNPNNTSWYAYTGVLNSTPFTSGNCVQATGPYTMATVSAPCGTGGGGGTGNFAATTAGTAAASQLLLQYVGGVGKLQAYSANNTAVGSFTLQLSTADGTTTNSFPMQCTSTGCTFNTPSFFTATLRPNQTITTVNCSTSGTVTFAQPFAGTAYRSANAHLAACVGTASYTYPNGFTYAPFVSGSATAAVSSATTTVLSINAASSTTGFVKVEEQD